jgi:alpha-ketoglutarate-dependent taurine dioxygenase
MNYNTISAQRIAGALGAEIAGVDLSRPLSDEVIGEIRQALLDHQVIFFHDQHLTPEQHLAFGRRFGELQIHDFVEPAEEDQHILEVRKEPYETRNFGGGWHTDVSYLERPSLGSVLYAREVPAVGGDTMFASQYLAYDALSDGMKAMLGGMTAIHSAGRIYGVNPDRSLAGLPSSMTIRYTEEAHGETSRAHPCRDRTQVPLCQRQLHSPLQGHDRGGERAAVELALSACGTAGIHLSLPMAGEFDRVLGQPLRPAQRHKRLPGPAPGHAPGHD